MGLSVSEDGGKEFKRVPEGVHVAVCTAVYDLGTQHSEAYNNNQKKVLIGWQFPDERVDSEHNGNVPMLMSRRYTASLNQKAQLRKDLEAWRGRAFSPEELKSFDLKNLLGKSCQIQVTHVEREGKTYAKITALMALPKGMPQRQPEGPVVYFDMDECKELPENTPEWIATIIADSPEFQAGPKCDTPAAPADGVPF